MAASLGGGGASGGLEPLDELVDGEGLGEGRAVVASGRGGVLSRLGGGGGLSGLDGRWRGGGGSGAVGRSGGSGGRSAAGRGTVPDLGTRDNVRGEGVVDVEFDTGVGGLVSLGHVDTSGREGSSSAAGDGDLTASVVELGLAEGGSLVETNELGADPVLARLHVGKLDRDQTLVVVEPVNTELAILETILPDLGPDVADTVGGSLSHVDHDGTLVGGSNGLILVVGVGSLVVVPLHADGGASSNLDLVSGGLTAVANHGSGGDIENGVVAVGRLLNSKARTHVLAANDEALESSVRGSEVGNSQDDSGLGEHGDGWYVEVGWFEKSREDVQKIECQRTKGRRTNRKMMDAKECMKVSVSFKLDALQLGDAMGTSYTRGTNTAHS